MEEQNSQPTGLLVGVVGLGLGLAMLVLVGGVGVLLGMTLVPTPAVAPPAASAPAPAPAPPSVTAPMPKAEPTQPVGKPGQNDPPYRGFDSSLFMQTAAEYRACCLQAYNLASLRLKQAVENPANKGKKLAVILDLDETVIDNSAFQAVQVRENIPYDQKRWEVWEEQGADQVRLIPGAKAFLDEAVKLGVTVVYITNRLEKFRNQTLDALKRLGVAPADPKNLKSRDKSSDKTSRRQEVEKEYTVVLLIGDNLRDFDEKFVVKLKEKPTVNDFESAIQERHAKVDADSKLFGEKWIILPNPVYGEWTKPLGEGKAAMEHLTPSFKPKP